MLAKRYLADGEEWIITDVKYLHKHIRIGETVIERIKGENFEHPEGEETIYEFEVTLLKEIDLTENTRLFEEIQEVCLFIVHQGEVYFDYPGFSTFFGELEEHFTDDFLPFVQAILEQFKLQHSKIDDINLNYLLKKKIKVK